MSRTEVDRERVISHLQIINTWATVDLRSPKEPIWSYRTLEDVKQWTNDAIALLKEQEPKSVELHTNSYGTKFYFCPKCKRELFHTRNLNFCERCGQALKWK